MHHIVSKTLTEPEKRIDAVVGLDARGFILGPIIALRLGAAFVPVRKKGKLPGQCISAIYEKEYGQVCASVDLRVVHRNQLDVRHRMFSRCSPMRSRQGRPFWSSTTSLPQVMLRACLWMCSQYCRWLGEGGWRTGQAARRNHTGVSLHHRAEVPQWAKQAGRSGVLDDRAR